MLSVGTARHLYPAIGVRLAGKFVKCRGCSMATGARIAVLVIRLFPSETRSAESLCCLVWAATGPVQRWNKENHAHSGWVLSV